MTPKEERSNLTQNRLRELLVYISETGEFFSRVRRQGIPFGRPRGSRNNFGYVKIKVDGIDYLAHRLAWLYVTGRWPEQDLDHKNGRRSDNSFANLREASVKQNRENRNPVSSNTSGFRGVSWAASRSKWLAQIKHYGIQNNLGRFDALVDAVAARLRAERNMFTHHRELT